MTKNETEEKKSKTDVELPQLRISASLCQIISACFSKDKRATCGVNPAMTETFSFVLIYLKGIVMAMRKEVEGYIELSGDRKKGFTVQCVCVCVCVFKKVTVLNNSSLWG